MLAYRIPRPWLPHCPLGRLEVQALRLGMDLGGLSQEGAALRELLLAHGGEAPWPRLGRGKLPTATRHAQVALALELLQPRKGQPPQAVREHADRQEAVGPTRDPARAVSRESPGWQDPMQVGMMVQVLAPGVEHGEVPNLRAQRLGVPGAVLEAL